MKSNSKFLTGFILALLASASVWVGCQNQAPSAAALTTSSVDKLSFLNLTSAGLGTAPSSSMVNTHIYTVTAEPAVTNLTSLIKASSYGMTPVTVLSGALPFQLSPPLSNPEGHNYVASSYGTSAWPGAYNAAVITTGLTDPYSIYGVQITGFINDPENVAYPPGPGNPDPIAFEFFPYFNGNGLNGTPGAYDISPFQGVQFYINIANVDDAVDRVFIVNTLQNQPSNQTPSGTCDSLNRPDLTHCYDGFQYDFTNSPKNQWVLIQKNWGDLKQYGFGSAQTPPTLSGTNLQQCIGFQWAFSNGSQAGPVTVSESIAGMRFF